MRPTSKLFEDLEVEDIDSNKKYNGLIKNKDRDQLIKRVTKKLVELNNLHIIYK